MENSIGLVKLLVSVNLLCLQIATDYKKCIESAIAIPTRDY